MKKTIIKGSLLLLIIASFAVISYFWQLPSYNKNAINVRIETGDTLSYVANRWQQQGWLPSALWLRVQAKILQKEQILRVGEFTIPAGINSYELLNLLANAQPIQYKLTLIEGTRIKEAINILKNAPHLRQDIPNLNSQKIQAHLQLKTPLEGLLYPDTYVYSYQEPVSKIIEQAYKRGQQQLQAAWQKRAQNLPYKTPYQALIMASIVEKETGVASERAQIAGVFVRRLQKGMRLETDPSVIYGVKDYTGNLTRRHLKDKQNPYNTYRRHGLPPTPIALVGRAAIDAALNPSSGNALYFVAKGDGSHYFSSNLNEHIQAVRTYQLKQRKKDYRSSPTPAQSITPQPSE